MLDRRFHLLLDKNLWNKIVKSSKAQKISAGEWIRRAVDKYLSEKEYSEENRLTTFKGFFKSKTPKEN